MFRVSYKLEPVGIVLLHRSFSLGARAGDSGMWAHDMGEKPTWLPVHHVCLVDLKSFSCVPNQRAHYCHNQAQPDMEDRRPATCTHRISSLPATVQCTLVNGDPCRGFNVWNVCGLPHELTLEVPLPLEPDGAGLTLVVVGL